MSSLAEAPHLEGPEPSSYYAPNFRTERRIQQVARSTLISLLGLAVSAAGWFAYRKIDADTEPPIPSQKPAVVRERTPHTTNANDTMDFLQAPLSTSTRP